MSIEEKYWDCENKFYHWTRFDNDINEFEEYVIEVVGNKIRKTPIVYPEDVDNIHVHIICPYCMLPHRHGSNKDTNYGGHRLAHCTDIATNRTKKFQSYLGKNKSYGYYIRDLKINEIGKSIGVKFTEPIPFSGLICNLGSGEIVELFGYRTDTYGALEMD